MERLAGAIAGADMGRGSTRYNTAMIRLCQWSRVGSCRQGDVCRDWGQRELCFRRKTRPKVRAKSLRSRGSLTEAVVMVGLPHEVRMIRSEPHEDAYFPVRKRTNW